MPPGRPRTPKTQIHDIEIDMAYYKRHQFAREDSDCIEWRGGMHRQGYGMIGAWRVPDGQKIMTTTHRVAARIAWNRAIDSGEFVIHTCSNFSCCNPDHLIPGDRHTIHQVMLKNDRYALRKKRTPSAK